MPVRKMKDFLDHHGVRYLCTSHSKAYTAQEVARLSHVSGQAMAKTVIVDADGRMVMAVLPARYKVDLNRLRNVIGAQHVELAPESRFKKLFPECEPGAMPPFGNLYGLEVFVDAALAEDEIIAFNSGTHTEVMRLLYKDYERLVQPKVLAFHG